MSVTRSILYRGENRLISRTLLLADGVTPLPVASLAGARVQLLQNDVIVAAAVLGTDPQLHQGASADELVYELTSAVTLALTAEAILVLRWTIKLPDAAFVVEPGVFIDVHEEAPYLVK